LPRETDLGRYDLLWLADVPRAQLPEPTLAALDSFVRQGGGLLVAGGTQSFGPGGYMRPASRQMLPVRLDIPERREEATLALALVIDKSGSMAGPKMDLTKEAARATAEALPPADQIAVIVFDSASNPVVRPAARRQPAAHPGRHRAHHRQRRHQHPVRPARGGRRAAARRAPQEAHHPAVRRGVAAERRGAGDGRRAAAARITISTVGVGEGADQTVLKAMATRGGGRFYHTRDPASIPRIFSAETSELGDRSIVEKPTARTSPSGSRRWRACRWSRRRAGRLRRDAARGPRPS
jgi:hypothetical protein